MFQALAVLGLTISSASCATGRANTPFEEITLSDYIEARLRADEELGDAEIDASTNDGVVMLAGNVQTQAHALRAVQIAETSPGVEQVLNALEVGNEDYEAPVLEMDAFEHEDSSESMQDPSWGVGNP